jgi:pimeloyl-ACP methyl ester carboxylesterase
VIEAIEVTTNDGVMLRGEVAIRASDWILLVHAPGEDIDAWRPLSSALEEYSLTVLAVDLRGHGGSDGKPDPGAADADIDAMAAYALSHGAIRMFLAAGGACASAAQKATERHPLEALILVAPVGLDQEYETPIPRLVLCDSEDPAQERIAAHSRDAPGWSLAISLPDAGAGLDLIGGDWQDNVIGYIAAFLRDVRLHQSSGLA